MPKLYPTQFREDVVRVVTNRNKNTTIGQIAKDFGVHEDTIAKWVRQAELDAGNPSDRTLGPTTDEKNLLRELRAVTVSSNKNSKSCAAQPPTSDNLTSRQNDLPAHEGARR